MNKGKFRTLRKDIYTNGDTDTQNHSNTHILKKQWL